VVPALFMVLAFSGDLILLFTLVFNTFFTLCVKCLQINRPAQPSLNHVHTLFF